MSEEDFQKGMAHAHEIVYQNIERLQQSLSDVMGMYIELPPRLMQEHPIVSELQAAHEVLSQFRERFVDDYDEEMREHKASKAWREDTDQLKSEWPE